MNQGSKLRVLDGFGNMGIVELFMQIWCLLMEVVIKYLNQFKNCVFECIYIEKW